MMDCLDILLKMSEPKESIPEFHLAMLKLLYQYLGTTLETNLPEEKQEAYESRLSFKDKAYLATAIFVSKKKPKKTKEKEKEKEKGKSFFSKFFG